MKNTFGDTIKRLREANNLTLREVAQVLDIDTSMLGKIEKNTRTPTLKFIEQVAQIFKVSEKQLRIDYLSDMIVYHVVHEEECAEEVLKAAKKKIVYLKEIKST